MNRTAVFRLLFFACALAVLALALWPHPPVAVTTGWDKSNHALAFFVLAILGRYAFPAAVVPMLCGVLGFGGGIELLQSWSGSRSGELGDWLADGVGMLLAFAALTVVRCYRAFFGAR